VVTPTRVVVGILLLAPFVALLWVSSYAKSGPELGGWPFFYWYQMLWVLISAAFTGVAYVLVQREEAQRKARRAAAGAGAGAASQAIPAQAAAPDETAATAQPAGDEGQDEDEEADK